MITVKELSSEEIADWEWRWKYGKVAGKHKAWRTTCTVEVYPDRQSKFTAVMYEGEDAECIWEKEFEKFSRTRNPLVAQLFGINRSEIPMLIFHDELIPLAHFFNKESIWMDVYIEHLRINMRCGRKRLWMNTASGVLLSGPDGPSAPSFRTNVVRSIIVPTTVDMLKDDTCIRFFINFGPSVDINIQWCAFLSFKVTFLDDLVPAMADNHQSKDSDYPNWGSATYLYLWHWQNRPNHLPMNIIGGLRFDTVYSPSMEAIARWPQGAGSLWEWREYNRKGLAEETVLDDRLTRFQLDLARGKEVYLGACHSYSWKFGTEWLSQSSWVFDAIGIVEERENFFIVKPPDLKIQSTRRPTASRTLCNDKHSVKETPPTPIYLFLHPFPVSVLELVSWIEGRPYFWSFDETGQSRMSEEECERWGLPMFTVSTCYPNEFLLLYSWSTHVYTTLRDWQKARGFDPTTSDWAQHMGCPQFEIFSKLGRVREDRGEKKASSSWWEAFAGSGISAFGI